MGIGVMYAYASTSFSSLVLHDNIIHKKKNILPVDVQQYN